MSDQASVYAKRMLRTVNDNIRLGGSLWHGGKPVYPELHVSLRVSMSVSITLGYDEPTTTHALAEGIRQNALEMLAKLGIDELIDSVHIENIRRAI